MSWATRRSRRPGSSLRRAEQEPEPRTRRGEERFRADSRSSRSPPSCSRLGGSETRGIRWGQPGPGAKMAQSSLSIWRVFLHPILVQAQAPQQPEQGGKGEHGSGETEAGGCSRPRGAPTTQPMVSGRRRTCLGSILPQQQRTSAQRRWARGTGSRTGCPWTSRNRPHGPPPPAAPQPLGQPPTTLHRRREGAYRKPKGARVNLPRGKSRRPL